MKVLILAAGYGTRLYPLTLDKPKALLKINGRPLIDYLLDKLKLIRYIEKIFLITNNKFFSQFKSWHKELITPFKKRIELINDGTDSPTTKLGAVGDMDFAIRKKKINTHLLVLGADNYFHRGFGEFLKFSVRSKRVVIGVYDVKDKNLAQKYGVIKMGKRNQVLQLQEKPLHPETTLVSVCMYYFPKRSLYLISEYMSRNLGKDTLGSYLDWLIKKEKVLGFKIKGPWYDIGDKKVLKRLTYILGEKR